MLQPRLVDWFETENHDVLDVVNSSDEPKPIAERLTAAMDAFASELFKSPAFVALLTSRLSARDAESGAAAPRQFFSLEPTFGVAVDDVLPVGIAIVDFDTKPEGPKSRSAEDFLYIHVADNNIVTRDGRVSDALEEEFDALISDGKLSAESGRDAAIEVAMAWDRGVWLGIGSMTDEVEFNGAGRVVPKGTTGREQSTGTFPLP